ncbi:hypothetical protein ACF1A9_37310 [Streptomyces sp. NPDC014872]|uniref:hypothetical protein n=1 Tax=unclassified Streptomyces TaxID=2593676 RepID=UPI003700453B
MLPLRPGDLTLTGTPGGSGQSAHPAPAPEDKGQCGRECRRHRHGEHTDHLNTARTSTRRGPAR